MKDADCPMCGKTFETVKAMKVHHAGVHGESIGGVLVQCNWCGFEFRRQPSTVRDRNYCSQRCYGKWKSENEIGPNSSNWNGGKRLVNCSWCGRELLRKPNVAEKQNLFFCSGDCQGEWNSKNLTGENHPNWEGGYRCGEGWTDSLKEKVRKRDGRECQHCGRSEKEHMEMVGRKHDVHHIRPVTSFNGSPYNPNKMENLVTLCQGECHSKWEKMSPLKPI